MSFAAAAFPLSTIADPLVAGRFFYSARQHRATSRQGNIRVLLGQRSAAARLPGSATQPSALQSLLITPAAN